MVRKCMPFIVFLVMVKKEMEMVICLHQRKFHGIPNYKDRDITEGSIYHVLMHGKELNGFSFITINV